MIDFYSGDVSQNAKKLKHPITKIDKKTVDEVMNYAKQKTNAKYNLEKKIFDIGNKEIWVASKPTDPINIYVFPK